MSERDRVWPSTFRVPWRQSGCCFLALLLLLADFAASPTLTGLSSRVVSAADAKPPVDARLLWRTGQYAECVDATAATLAKTETDEAARLLKLQAEMELGRYADALATLDAGLKKLPASVLLRWFGRDVCRYNQQAERAATLETQ